MPTRPADRELRRLITEVAEAREEDIEAILGQLEPDKRDRIRTLLSNYGIRAPLSRDWGDPPGTSLTPGVSPWLAARMASGGGLGAALRLKHNFSVTSDTVRVLRSLAAASDQVAAPPDSALPIRRWLRRLQGQSLAARGQL